MFARRKAGLPTFGLIWLLSGCPAQKTTPPPPPESAPRADLVLTGGVVLSDAKPGATAVAIDDGKIVGVGSDDEVKSWIGEGTRVVQLSGHTVLPGLVDSHLHLAGIGSKRFELDLVGTNSLDQIKEKIAEAVKSAQPGAWIRGRGWDQNDWEGFDLKRQKFPTAADLDKVAPNHPVILTRIDGHAVWVNSKAMKAAGIDNKTKVSGGEIVKVRGKPSGIFVDNAIALIAKHVPPLSGEDLERAMTIAQEECLRAGLTQVHDMGLGASELAALKKLDAAGSLKLRVYAMHDWTSAKLEPSAEVPIIPEPGSKSRLTVRGVKLMIDGALGSRGAALLAPYADDKKNKGLVQIEPEELERRVRMANDKGFQVATHAIGDRGNRIVLDVYQKVFGAAAWMKRPRIEHAQVLAPEDLPRFGQLGVIASIQPTHATSDMPWAEQRVGKERIKGAYAWQALLTSNATVSAGSDAPVEDHSPILGLYAATTRKDLLGEPASGWYADQKMTPQQAIDAFTRGANYAAFQEKELGRIAEGYLADLTVLDRNPLTASEGDLSTATVQLTIIEGEVLYEKAPAQTATSTSP